MFKDFSTQPAKGKMLVCAYYLRAAEVARIAKQGLKIIPNGQYTEANLAPWDVALFNEAMMYEDEYAHVGSDEPLRVKVARLSWHEFERQLRHNAPEFEAMLNRTQDSTYRLIQRAYEVLDFTPCEILSILHTAKSLDEAAPEDSKVAHIAQAITWYHK